MTHFVWSKMQAAGGETLDRIIVRKEAERYAGHGEFWWGIGNSLGSAIDDAVGKTRGDLPVLFSRMLSPPKKADSSPHNVCVWDGWQTYSGKTGKLPDHVLITGGSDPNKSYYALVCHSDHKIELSDHGKFDPSECRTALGKRPGASQVTAILMDQAPGAHRNGVYKFGFRAKLAAPWAVKLTNGRPLSIMERRLIDRFDESSDWLDLVRAIRQ
jgi:hypothetical protein